jgi:PAS domain S-box-containing protein
MSTKRSKVLLIEDDRLHAQVIEGMAKSDEGLFEIEIVDSLEAGAKRAASGDIELIILDLALTEGEGANNFKAIHNKYPDIPTIILSTPGHEDVVWEAINSGATDYLVKWQLNSNLLQRSMRYAIESKRTEIALREHEFVLRHLANSLPEVIVLFNLTDNRVVYGNEHAIQMFGSSIINPGFFRPLSHVHPEDFSRVRDSFEILLENSGQESNSSEFRVKNGSNEWRWLDCRHVVYRRDDGGKPLEILCTAHDITERKLAEAALRESEDRYRDLVENGGLYIGTHDAEGRILTVNQLVLDFLGLIDPAQIIGKNIGDFLSRKGGPPFVHYLKTVLTEGRATGIAKFQNSSGRAIYIEYINSSRRDVKGAPIVRCIGRDVSSRVLTESALGESEERLRLALSAIEMGAWEWNMIDDRMIGDEYVRKLIDVGDGGIEDVYEKIHPDDRQLIREKVEVAIDEDGVRNLQFRVRVDEGPERWVECSANLRRDDAGNPVGVIGVMKDITDRRRFEELQLLLGSAVRNAKDSILITTAQRGSLDPQIVFVNPAFSQMTGYQSEEVIGKTIGILHGPKTDREALGKLKERIDRGESYSTEMINYRKDGSEYTVEWHISPIRSQNKEITHFVSVQHDISDRKRTEERLREQADLLDNATDAIVLLSLEEKITYWNSGAQRLYGWTFDEVRDRRLIDVLHRDGTAPNDHTRQLLATQAEWRGELTHVTKDGREVMVESRWTLLRDARNNPKSIFVINTDITEKKRLESVVLRAQRMESIGALASGIAHDLNNVLAPILMALHTLKQRFTDESSQRWLSLVHKSAERGKDLVERVLAFASGAEGERAPLQTANLIYDLARILGETLPKDIELHVQVPDDLWSVIGDTTQIHQVLMNLCINARDAMPAGGKLLIKARNRYLTEAEERLVTNPLQKQYVRITVADTGVGIPSEIIDRIFDPFFTTKDKGKGSGLGLATALSIVRGHGGFINLSSKVGIGTEFKIYLPAGSEASVEQSITDKLVLPNGKGELILVIDDEEDIREAASATLIDQGYRVVTAGDGLEAVEIYRQRSAEIQLVLTDMVMPHLDGPATIRELKQINPDLTVIVTSGVRSTGKLSLAKQLGIKTFLPKPYTAEKLLTLVAESLSASSPPRLQ